MVSPECKVTLKNGIVFNRYADFKASAYLYQKHCFKVSLCHVWPSPDGAVIRSDHMKLLGGQLVNANGQEHS